MKERPILLLLLAILGCAGTAAPAPPQWPQFRGLNSCGVAEADKPPVNFGPTTNLLWKSDVPGGVSSPILHGDRMFLTAADGDKFIALCLDRHDGKILWRQAVPAGPQRELHKKNHLVASTPVTDGKRVCAYFPGFGLVAYDFAGRELWRQSLTNMYVRNGSGTSPALLEGRLVLNCDVEEGKSFLASFDPGSGKELWRVSRADFLSGYTTPVLWHHDARDEIVVVGSLRVMAYGLADGKEQWFTTGTEAVSVCPTPVIGDGQLYVMSRSFSGSKLPPFTLFVLGTDKDGDGKVSRAEAPRQFIEQGMFGGLDRDNDGFITEKEWDESVAFLNRADYGIFAIRPPAKEERGDLSSTHVAWKHRKGVASVSSPLYYQNRVYVVQDGGRATCFEAKTGGKVFEQERIGAEGEYFASPLAADGKVFFCSTAGKVTVIESGDGLKVLAKNDLQEPIFATPALADDKLYIRTAGHLWAFGQVRR
jgi:outer membrane protein assembly factor BamB